jgi:hypothetical protein
VTNRIHSSTLNFLAVDVEQFTGVRAGDLEFMAKLNRLSGELSEGMRIVKLSRRPMKVARVV